jgi:5'-3' exonuclease
MGIPGLFAWLRKNCPHLIRILPSNKSMSAEMQHDIENLCLDMNGIFHEACQKVYKYGNHALVKSKIHPEKELPPPNVMRKRVFQEVGKIVNNLVYRVRPTRRVLIMVDGPAGNAKQSQQRQRRYRSVQDLTRKFDSNCISPGTEWMDFLSKYMDQFIRREVTHNPIWRGLHVIFSNEKVAGEGEHKLIRFIRKHGTPTESYVLYGLDADLIMLTLSTQNILATGSYALNPPKFYILREDQYSRFPQHLIVDITMLRQYLIEELTWGLDCSRNNLINDYIFLCFLLGNDFLPHSPTVDLIEGGLELLFESYSGACAKHNCHLMKEGDTGSTFSREVLKDILYNISMSERIILEDSVKRGDKFADPLLQRYISYTTPSVDDVAEDVEDVEDEIVVEVDVESLAKNLNELLIVEENLIVEEAPDAFLEAPEEFVEDEAPPTASATSAAPDEKPRGPIGVPKLNFDMYRTEYYSSKFPRNTPMEVCHEYFRGMEWVYRYYTTGIPSWTWTYPFFYSPFAREMVTSLDTYVSKPFQMGRPMEPFRQLLSILPPQSKELLPSALHPVIEKFPGEAKVDLAGKKFDWQGVVLVPPLVDFDREYRGILDQMPIADKRRNFLGKEYAYRFRPDLTYMNKTYYGEFQCSTEVTVFE